MLEDALAGLARSQHGVVTRNQLLDIGFTRGVIERMVSRRRLRPLHRGVYLVGPVAPKWADEVAAVLACEPRAFLSHVHAVRAWGLATGKRTPAKVEVTVVGRDPGAKPRIRVHRISTIGADETTRARGIVVSTPARTILDMAPRLSEQDLERMVAEGFRRRLLRPGALTSLLARYQGRPGTPALRRLLSTERGPAFTRRALEKKFLAAVRRAGLPEPEVNVELGPFEVDFLWRDQRLVVETDSWQFHSDRRAFEADRLRDAELVVLGFRVVRITWRQLVDTPAAVVARVAAALELSALPDAG